MNFIAWILLSVRCLAYIPEYSMIASHAADQHGKGAYLIEQEVTVQQDAEKYSVVETWQILNEGALRVSFEGRGSLRGLVHGTVIYDGSAKHFVADGQNRQQRLGDDWFEPLFHFRTSRYLRSRLVSLKIAPPESLRDRPSLSAEGDPGYTAPDFIRLSRVGGSTAWAIGAKPSGGESMAAWIEQDQFLLRKLRGSRSLVSADDYVKYSDGLWLPRLRTYTFGKNIVQVRTLSVRSLGKMKEDARFRPSSLSGREALKLPEAEPLREFLTRFR